MPQPSRAVSAVALCLLPLFLPMCATAPQTKAPAPERKAMRQDSTKGDSLVQDLRDIVSSVVRLGRDGRKDREERAPGPLASRVQELAADMRQRIQEDFRCDVVRQLGLKQPLLDDTVALEAVDEAGNVVEVEFVTPTRQLRTLTAPDTAAAARNLFEVDSFALGLYEDLPAEIEPDDARIFLRHYTGPAAEAIATEAKLIVELKGGEWDEPAGGKRAANAVAVRGLDFELGLKENGNKTYDDTVYIVIEDQSGVSEVLECRMTTESSSAERGVGRLNSKQVTYVRGLHKGKDPGYRLLGNAAQGTRRGLEGDYQIVGANIHSAYTRRPIGSNTPLSPTVSLGCQVVATSKTEFERSLVFFLDSKGVRRFPYTIVEDEELALLNDFLREQGKASILAYRVPR